MYVNNLLCNYLLINYKIVEDCNNWFFIIKILTVFNNL